MRLISIQSWSAAVVIRMSLIMALRCCRSSVDAIVGEASRISSFSSAIKNPSAARRKRIISALMPTRIQQRHYGGRPVAQHFSSTPAGNDVACSLVTVSEAERAMTRDARSMVDAAIRAVDPAVAVQAHLHFDEARNCLTVKGSGASSNSHADAVTISIDLSEFDDTIVVVAFGKASAAMACAVVECLSSVQQPPKKDLVGLVIAKDGHVSQPERELLERNNIRVREAAHPVPDERSVAASKELLKLVQEHTTSNHGKSLLLACISGGGSALFCSPRPPLTLQDLQDTNTALLQSGWRIQEMNVVRQCLESGKGGGLAQAAGTSTVLSLILSDVLGDPLDLIASGPTVMSDNIQRKFTTAWNMIKERQNLQLPAAVLRVLREGYYQEQERRQNSSSTSSQVSTRVDQHPNHHFCLVGNNDRAVLAAADQSVKLGYHPIVLTTHLQGEAASVAQILVGLAQHLREISSGSMTKYSLAASPNHFPMALIAGGETTVTLPSSSDATVGKGGRNQELALAAALALQTLGLREVVLASVGTDGTDGPTDAAGAVVDGTTVRRLPENMSAEQALRQHNAYAYLDRCDSEGASPLVKVRMIRANGRGKANEVEFFMLTVFLHFHLRRQVPQEPMWLTFV